MGEAKRYTGGCHCGAVRYEIDADLTQVIACNCSICTKHGLLLTFTPADRFRLVAGQEQVQDYQFNKHVIHHQFCPTCGVEPFARGKNPDGLEMIAINVRCLDGIDVGALKPMPIDGKSL
jgi:hypothetical protein